MPAKRSGIRCVPGQRLCFADELHVGGHGTYARDGVIHSSLTGVVMTETDSDGVTQISVKRGDEQHVVPSTGSIVTARVTSVNPRFCKCKILCIEDTVLKEPFRAIIKKEDVRATHKDKVELYKCFRPRDIILARVLSLGDALSYLLSTAENELGVVIAHSEAGAAMVPVSWTEMQCPKTFMKEPRKVAKVVPQDFLEPAQAPPGREEA